MRRLVAGLGVAVACAAGAQGAQAADEVRPASRATLLVKLDDDSRGDVAAFERRHDLEVVRSFPEIDWVEVRTGTRTAAYEKSLVADDAVLDAEAMRPGEAITPAYTPRDEIWNLSKPFYQDGSSATWHFEVANFPAAWDQAKSSSATTIGVIDSEFNTSHPDLQTKLKTGYNTNSGTAQYHTANIGLTNGESCSIAHGTHVAGIAAGATDNAQGISGAGFDSTILPVRTSVGSSLGQPNVDSKFVADLAEALLYVSDKNLPVVTMSLGAPREFQALNDAIQVVRSKGTTVIASAGNSQQQSPGQLNYPAAYPGVIGVANTQSNDTINPSSSNGDFVDIAAPGTNILSTWEPGCQGNFGTGYNSISGTSMSAPMVAGLVALMKSARPDLTPDEVEALLTRTAVDLGAGGKDPIFGAGRINALAAVNAAKAYVRPAPPQQPQPPQQPVIPQQPPVPPAVVSSSGKTKWTKRSRTLAVPVRCAQACLGRVVAKAGSRTLKSASFQLAAGKAKTVALKLSSSQYKTLRKAAKGRRKTAKVSFTITASNAAGTETKVTRTLSVKRP